MSKTFKESKTGSKQSEKIKEYKKAKHSKMKPYKRTKIDN